MSMIPVNRKFLRGDIYYANLEPHLGSEQGGIRPVLILSNKLYQLDLNEWVWRKEAYERYLRYHR